MHAQYACLAMVCFLDAIFFLKCTDWIWTVSNHLHSDSDIFKHVVCTHLMRRKVNDVHIVTTAAAKSFPT